MAAPMPVVGPSNTALRQQVEKDGSENDQNDPRHQAAILDLITRLLRVHQIAIARNQIAKLIAGHLQASFVAVGANALQTTPCPLAAIAGNKPPADETRDDVEAALGECVVTSRIHRGKSGTNQAGFAHQRLARLLNQTGSICSVPLLTDDGRCAGAMLVAWPDDCEDQDVVRTRMDFLLSVSTPLAELLLNIERNTPSMLAARWKTARNLFTRQRKLCLLAVVAGLLVIGLIPVRYPVLANVAIQPTVRRWVVAPFAAPLNRSYVTPGQSVKVGELLFTLDCEETLNKLASLRAEAERSTSERSAHLSGGRLADAAIAGWSTKGTNSEIELLTKHLDRAEIRSPVDGVVLGEDLARLEGSPLESGQMLIEVAQIERMHVEIEIPTDQIFRTTLGSQVTVTVDSAGSLPTLTLSQLHPRAEPNEEGKYVFHGRAELLGANEKLRPGMRGQATIHGEYRPLVWCLIQRLWQQLRNWA